MGGRGHADEKAEEMRRSCRKAQVRHYKVASFQERTDALHSYEQAHHDAQAECRTEGKGAILCEDAKAHAQHHPYQRSDEERRESLLEIEE